MRRHVALACGFFPVLLLGSCISLQTAPEKMADKIEQHAPVTPPLPGASPNPKAEVVSQAELDQSLSKAADKIIQENKSSNNANQNNITGLGANVNKLAEDMTAVKGDLAHVEANFSHLLDVKLDQKFDLMMKNTLTVKDINATMDTRFEAQSKIWADFKNDFKNEMKGIVEASVQAQVTAGVGNSMKEFKQTIDAQNVKFEDNTRVANQWVAIILIMALALVCVVALFAWLIIRLQIKRTEQAERHAEKALDIHAAVVTRALGGKNV